MIDSHMDKGCLAALGSTHDIWVKGAAALGSTHDSHMGKGCLAALGSTHDSIWVKGASQP